MTEKTKEPLSLLVEAAHETHKDTDNFLLSR
jgi:hypothetical protein